MGLLCCCRQGCWSEQQVGIWKKSWNEVVPPVSTPAAASNGWWERKQRIFHTARVSGWSPCIYPSRVTGGPGPFTDRGSWRGGSPRSVWKALMPRLSESGMISGRCPLHLCLTSKDIENSRPTVEGYSENKMTLAFWSQAWYCEDVCSHLCRGIRERNGEWIEPKYITYVYETVK